MNKIIETVTNDNMDAAKTAAILTAGNVANTQLVKLVASKSPMVVRGYVNTPIGKLVIANIAPQVMKHMRPDDTRLSALTEGMVVSAYQEIINTIDIDSLLEEFLNQAQIKKALTQVGS